MHGGKISKTVTVPHLQTYSNYKGLIFGFNYFSARCHCYIFHMRLVQWLHCVLIPTALLMWSKRQPDTLCSALLLLSPQGLCPKSFSSHCRVAEAVQLHDTHRKCANPFPLDLLTPGWKCSHADPKTLVQSRLGLGSVPILHTTMWKHPPSGSKLGYRLVSRGLPEDAKRNASSLDQWGEKKFINPWPKPP